MPNVGCCDVCYYQRKGAPIKVGGEKLVFAKWTIARKNQFKRVKLMVCEEHKDFFKDCSTIEACEAKIGKLYAGQL